MCFCCCAFVVSGAVWLVDWCIYFLFYLYQMVVFCYFWWSYWFQLRCSDYKLMPSVLMPSVLWRCWLGGREGIRPVKKQSGGVLAWSSVWSEVQTCIWPSWCHCHSLSLAPVKSRLVLPFWYRLTQVVLEKRPLNGCCCCCCCCCSDYKHPYLALISDYFEETCDI